MDVSKNKSKPKAKTLMSGKEGRAVISKKNCWLLVDAGNTHVRVCLGGGGGWSRILQMATADLAMSTFGAAVRRLVRVCKPVGAMVCSVVPNKNDMLKAAIRRECGFDPTFLGPSNLIGIGIDYPRPKTIGADRLANAMAAHALLGAPVIVVDFGTAVTFDVVDHRSNYAGGIIAPGLSAMTDYLHEKTALLPRIRIRDPQSVVGKNTSEAMLIGAVHGYRGLITGLLKELKEALKSPRLPVIATGGYAELISRDIPDIERVNPRLTMEGLLIAASGKSPLDWGE